MIQMGKGQNDQQDQVALQETTKLVYWASCAIASCFWIPLRKELGRDCPGLPGLSGLGFMVVYGAFTDEPLMLWYAAAWFVLLIYRRFEGWALAQRGVQLHSQYTGVPWLAMKLPGVRSEGNAKTAEAALCFIAALPMSYLSVALARFLFLGGIALGIVRLFEYQLIAMRLQRMRDAEIEQRYLRDLHRSGSDEY